MDTDKSKDNVKARVDLAELCDRTKQEMRPPSGRNKNWKRPKVDFILITNDRRKVLQWIKNLKFPDGYAANLSR
jgi:hypothetical protein